MSEKQTKAFSLTAAYDFGKKHGLAKEIAAIHSITTDWVVQKTKVLRGFMAQLFRENELLGRYIKECWHNGATSEGKECLEYAESLRIRQLEYMGETDENPDLLRDIGNTLTLLAKQLHAVLFSDLRCLGIHEPLPRLTVPQNDSTKGYWLQVARLSEHISVELWLDHFSGSPTPRIWFGLSSRSHESLARILRRLPVNGYKSTVTKRSSVDVSRKSPYQFLDPLRSTEFDSLVHENYPNDRHYLGIYSSQSWPITRPKMAKVCRDANNLMASFCVTISTPEATAFEGQRTEVVIYRQGRSRTLRDGALAASQGVCEACSTDFSVLLNGDGKKVLEVHHRKQLAATDRPRLTKRSDLAVLCANCHRLVHLNPKKALSVDKLRRLLRHPH